MGRAAMCSPGFTDKLQVRHGIFAQELVQHGGIAAEVIP